MSEEAKPKATKAKREPLMLAATIVETGPNGDVFVAAKGGFHLTCDACAGNGLRTERETRLGFRLVRLRRVRKLVQGGPKSTEKLIARCTTCGGKLKTLTAGKVTRELWNAIPEAPPLAPKDTCL